MPYRERNATTLKRRRFRELIANHDIEFRGPIPPSKWPERYKNIFDRIRDIDRERFDEYQPGERRAILSVAQMKERVRKLVSATAAARRELVNEYTLRLRTEPHVVARFETEVIW